MLQYVKFTCYPAHTLLYERVSSELNEILAAALTITEQAQVFHGYSMLSLLANQPIPCYLIGVTAIQPPQRVGR